MTADAVGGVWTYATELIAGLNGFGIDVDLAVVGPRPTAEQLEQLPDLASYQQAPFRLEWMEDPWDDVARAGDWLLELARDADLVHLNGYAHASVDFGIPVVLVAHSCVLSWHEATRQAPAGEEWARYAGAVRAGLDAADVVVSPTRALLDELERLYRFRGERLVIPNGRQARPAPTTSKQPLVLGVGRVWDEAKNLAALERVAPALEWPVLVAGAGGALGHVSDAELGQLYARAAVFAAPARYEPFGLAALEAAFSRCALVLGDIPTLREVWDAAALYVDPFDDDALTATLQRLIADAPLRAKLAAAAHAHARRYSRSRMAAGYVDLYKRVGRPARLELPA